MEMEGLVEKQQALWNGIGVEVGANFSIKAQALQFYLQYRRHMKKTISGQSEDRIGNIMRIAYFLSEKSEPTYNLKGNKVNGIALSINTILKKQHNFQDFLYTLKQMMKVVIIQDEQVENEINIFIRRFSFIITFYNKFHSTFKKIHAKITNHLLHQSLLWLIFIHARNHLFSTIDIVESTCLLASVLIYYLQEIHQQVDSFDCHTFPNIQTIKSVMMDYFRVKDYNTFEKIDQMFKRFVKEVKQEIGEFVLFGSRVQDVYKKMDAQYQRQLEQNQIDERHFLQERVNTNLQHNRFTPFGGVARKMGKWRNQNAIANRILTYELSDIDQNQKNLNNTQSNHLVDIGLLKRIQPQKTPESLLIKATPMTQAMELYNWLHQKSNENSIPQGGDINLDKLLPVGQFQENSLKQRRKLVYGLWKDILKHSGEKLQQSKLAYLVLAAQVSFYVLNVPETKTESMLVTLKLSWLDLWQKFEKVISYDKKMPTVIRVHLLALETTVITQHLWGKELKLVQILSEEGKNLRTKNLSYEKLHKRVIHHMAYETYLMSKNLHLNEETSDCIFIVIQHTICQFSQILINRNLDQIILCCIYAVCRAIEANIKFNEIITVFKQLNNLNKQYYCDLIEGVEVGGQKEDIISFYNKVFIKKIKTFLLQVKYKKSQLAEITFKNNYIASPVKSLLPKEITSLAKTLQSDTPQMQALFAYNQSPLLKEKRKKNINNVVGQGLNLALLSQDLNQQTQIEDTIQLINKKFKKTTSPQMKFVNYRNMNK